MPPRANSTFGEFLDHVKIFVRSAPGSVHVTAYARSGKTLATCTLPPVDNLSVESIRGLFGQVLVNQLHQAWCGSLPPDVKR
jgi:hypothetical protein